MIKRLKIILLFVAGSIGCLSASAKAFNNGVVKGLITDEQKKPLPFVTVLLKKTTDSTLCKGDVSNEQGIFTMEEIKEGNYFLEVKGVGLETKIIPGLVISTENPVIDLGVIATVPSSLGLKAVNIQADKPFIERQVDRMVVNIENSVIHAGSSISEVLEKLPGVLVNQDGAISMKGKQGVIVMIDGKPTMMGMQELDNMLKGMSSSNVQKIELITNPSAKYEAAGNAGIINIVMKKNRKEGLNGSVNAGVGQGRYGKYNAGFNLSMKDKWYNAFVNYTYSHRKGFNNLKLTRYFYNKDTLNTVFQTDNYIIFPFSTHTPRVGADFYLSKKTTLSVLGTSVINQFEPSAINHTDIMNGEQQKTGSFDFTNHSHDKWYNYAFNTQLKHQFDTSGTELSVDLDFADYWNKTDQRYTNTVRDAFGNYMSESLITGDLKGELKIYSLKADFVHPLQHNAKLEAGFKSSYVTTDNDVKFFNQVNNEMVFDSLQSNHFLYSENINAGYLNWSKELKKLTVQLGLRAEQTLAKGEQIITGQKFDRNYMQIFPASFLDYKFNDKHSLNLNLGRRIDRPAYQQMNPFRHLIDATTFAAGNPYLLPQLTYNSELTYSYKSMFFATFGYSFTTDNITDVLIQDGQKKQTIQTVVNLARFDYYNVNLVFSKKLKDWWTTNTGVLSYYGIYDGTINNYVILQRSPSFNINTGNTFAVAEGLSFECNFWYSHKNIYGVTTMLSSSGLTVGLQKSLFKKKAGIILNVTDLLWNSYPAGITHFGEVDEYWTAVRDTRVVNLNFTYRFGKSQVKGRRQTGADDEKKRTGV